MKHHTKIYLKAFGYGLGDFIPCEVCESKAVDIHHIVFRSQLGTDEIDNLMALCRSCHDKAHNMELTYATLINLHHQKIENHNIIIWKPVVDYENLYEVSNFGDVRKLTDSYNQFKEGHILKHNVNRGYCNVQLHDGNSCKGSRVHRLVLSSFVLNKEGKPCVNHLNNNRSDNKVSNLEWCTHSENEKHKYTMGYVQKKKLSKTQIDYVKKEYESYNKTAVELSEELNVSVSLITKYVDLKKKCNGTGNGSAKLNEKDIPIIKKLRENGLTYQDIAKKYNVCYQTISRIINGKGWTHVS